MFKYDVNEDLRAINQGQCYWCKDRFFDMEGNLIEKETTHPYIVVSDDEFNSHSCSVLAVMVTTNMYECPTNTIITGYKGLQTSTVKGGTIHSMPKALIGDYICNIRKGDFMNIQNCMSKALGFPCED